MRTGRLLAILMSAAVVGLAGCEQEGPAERTGERIDDALSETQDRLEETREEAEEAAEELRDAARGD